MCNVHWKRDKEVIFLRATVIIKFTISPYYYNAGGSCLIPESGRVKKRWVVGIMLVVMNHYLVDVLC